MREDVVFLSICFYTYKFDQCMSSCRLVLNRLTFKGLYKARRWNRLSSCFQEKRYCAWKNYFVSVQSFTLFLWVSLLMQKILKWHFPMFCYLRFFWLHKICITDCLFTFCMLGLEDVCLKCELVCLKWIFRGADCDGLVETMNWFSQWTISS